MAKIFSVVCLVALFAVQAKAGIYGGGGHGYESNNHEAVSHAEQQFQHLGTFVGKHHLPPKEIRITKTVAVKIPAPYPVKVPHAVPYPVHVVKHVPVPVPKIIKVTEQVPVPVPKPYPVPVYKHEAAPQAHAHAHQIEEAASYSAPVHQQQQVQQADHQAMYNYYKENGKYTSPVFDISAFHPSVLNSKGQSSYQGNSYVSVGHQQQEQHQQQHQQQQEQYQPQSYGGGAENHIQQESHSGLEQQIHAIQGHNYGHEEQQQQVQHQVQQQHVQEYHQAQEYHHQAQQQQSQLGGHESAGQEATYLPPKANEYQPEQHGQDTTYTQYVASAGHQQQAAPASAGGHEDYSQQYSSSSSAASAGQEQAYDEKQAEEYSGYAHQGGHEEQQQQHVQVEQKSHYEVPSAPQHHQAQPQQQHNLPAAHTYAYFHLGNGGGHGGSSGFTHAGSIGNYQSYHRGHSEQPKEQVQHYYQSQPQAQQQQIQIQHGHQSYEQQIQQQGHGHQSYEQQQSQHQGHRLQSFEQQIKALESQNTGSYKHNIGQSVLKEVQGPQFSGQGQHSQPGPAYLPPTGFSQGSQSLKSRPIYLPPTHGHYRSQ